MKKKLRRRPPDEIKVIVDKKLDEMEYLKNKSTDKHREYFYRKPYGLGDVRDDMQSQ